MAKEKKGDTVKKDKKSKAESPVPVEEMKVAAEPVPEVVQKDGAEGKSEVAGETLRDVTQVKPGDEIKVYYRVIEGGKERIQAYEGIVIAVKNSGISKTMTVRKSSFGVAVERIFPLYSKLIQKIELKKHSRVRRAKLYYLRKLKGKASRLKELR